MTTNFASSEGWNVSPPSLIHRRAPLIVLPTPGTNVATSNASVMTRSPITARWSEKARWSDRKSTRLNSSHQLISYAVFCLKKKKKYRNKRENRSMVKGKGLGKEVETQV